MERYAKSHEQQYIQAEHSGEIFVLHQLPIVDQRVYDVSRHEVMHGLINPGDVIAMSTIPQGSALGWTLVKNPTDAAIAAGIVHGTG